MMKYKGKYRLKAPIDDSTGEFARDESGKYVDDDVYITCKKGMIYHYGGSTLEALVEPENYSSGRFKERFIESGDLKRDKDYFENLISEAEDDEAKEKAIKKMDKYYEDNFDEDGEERPSKKYEEFVSSSQSLNKILKALGDKIIKGSIIRSDIGGSFRFNAKYLDDVAELMKAKTYGSSISPFSKKNLPKDLYKIPEEDASRMKALIKGLELQEIMRLYREFGKRYNVESNKVSIHKSGLWNELLGFIEENASSEPK